MDLEPLRPWNSHWFGSPITPRILKHPVPQAAVAKWVDKILQPQDDLWLLRPGPRQVGKTTSLGHVASQLVEQPGVVPQQIVIAPMDDPEILEASNGKLESVLAAAVRQHAPSQSKPLFILLDEIQELPDWAKQLKAAWDKHHATIRVLATGSSAFRILRPANADFHGRVRTVTVPTMKFREVLEAHPDAAERLPGKIKTILQKHALACRAALLEGHDATGAAFDELHGFLHANNLMDWTRQLWLEYLAWGGYPATRPGGVLTPVERLDRFGSALDTVLARDVSGGGIRKLRAFRLLFRGISMNAGGKFQPYRYGKDLGVSGEVVQDWKQILDDTMLVQQLPPLKPNLRPDRGADKAYPTDSGWISFFHGHSEGIPGQNLMGPAAENVVIYHIRRIQFNITGQSQLPIGYVAKPEVDVAANLDPHWLLMEVKYRANPQANFNDIGGPDDIRIVATRDTYQLNEAPTAHFIPTHEIALVC